MAAPLGNTNGAKGKRWHDALHKALVRYTSTTDDLKIQAGEALDKIAEVVVLKALMGDKDAITEIGNRLDGKAAQSVTVAGDSDNPLSVVQRIERVLVHANTQD